MIKNLMTPQAAQLSPAVGMPDLGRDRVSPVRVLAMPGIVSAFAAGSSSTTAAVEGNAVCAYRHINDLVAKGAFPGVSAWSPPV